MPVEAVGNDFVAHIDSASYEVHDDWKDAVPKVARAHAKMAAQEAVADMEN
mgnify:CR=1 FL=1